jgi:signal transduction histidine kinase
VNAVRRLTRSISLPIVLAAVTVALSIALLVGWTLLIALTPEVARHRWLLVAGIASITLIMGVLVVFSVFLVREILEVRRQDSFIDSVTHELKSPLASLKLCLQTLDRPDLSPTQREELREMMIDDVERLSVFIDDVLEASRIAHRRGGHSLVEVEVGPLLRHCASTVAKRYKTPAEAIEVEAPGDLKVFTDPTALEVVVKNLIDNAVKYSDEPVRVQVRASQNDSRRAVIEVRDNGIGIPREHLRRIFARFYRVPAESVRSRRGTGLGLFVVSALVRSLGGRLVAHSRGPGHGTRMEVVLPLDPGRPGRAA